MKTLSSTLLTAALLCGASLASAGAPQAPRAPQAPAPVGRDGTATEMQQPGSVDARQRPGDRQSRYSEAGIDKGPATANDMSPPQDGSAMDMNDTTNEINDSTLEMPRPNPAAR